MGLTALALSAVGAGLGVYGSIEQAKANEDTYNYNAALADEKAAAERADAQAQMASTREETRMALAKQRAQFATANLENTGSVLETQAESARQMEYNVQNLSYNSQTAYRAATNEAALLRSAGRQRPLARPPDNDRHAFVRHLQRRGLVPRP